MTNDTLLLKQVHHTKLSKAGIVSADAFVDSTVFVPRKDEEGKTSVYNGDRFSGEAAWKHYTTDLGLSSEGVIAVTVQECTDQSLSAVEDNEGFEGHASIDFNGLPSKGAWKRAATLLRDLACKRGWLYQAQAS